MVQNCVMNAASVGSILTYVGPSELLIMMIEFGSPTSLKRFHEHEALPLDGSALYIPG
uniref:Uncharacterized protein n=1 Tax=Mycobacterium phage Farewell TaxID=3158893 RepID=A0AAU8GLF0_9CAUD